MSRRLDLPPRLYELLQRFVHRGHEGFGMLVRPSFAPYAPGPALELGCGNGTLSKFFQSGEYVGCDLDAGRIELARRAHPEHEFVRGDATELPADFVARFPFVFCHAWVHHIDDEPMRRILERIAAGSRAAKRPIEMLIVEPLLPERVLANPFGYTLAKLDRGRFVRPDRAMRELFGAATYEVIHVHGPWYWPVDGAIYRLRFRPEA